MNNIYCYSKTQINYILKYIKIEKLFKIVIIFLIITNFTVFLIK